MILVKYQALNSENDNLSFEVFFLLSQISLAVNKGRILGDSEADHDWEQPGMKISRRR